MSPTSCHVPTRHYTSLHARTTRHTTPHYTSLLHVPALHVPALHVIQHLVRLVHSILHGIQHVILHAIHVVHTLRHYTYSTTWITHLLTWAHQGVGGWDFFLVPVVSGHGERERVAGRCTRQRITLSFHRRGAPASRPRHGPPRAQSVSTLAACRARPFVPAMAG